MNDAAVRTERSARHFSLLIVAGLGTPIAARGNCALIQIQLALSGEEESQAAAVMVAAEEMIRRAVSGPRRSKEERESTIFELPRYMTDQHPGVVQSRAESTETHTIQL
jgi:hypothetical protein